MTSFGKPGGNNADISVIIPVFNVKEYLNECLDSLADQGNVSLQVILVDDGSTDGSSEILKAYADAHENSEYLRLENKGVGFARNEGVKHASGEYITFLDGDDVVVPGTYERMLELARSSGAEMTICNAERFNSRRSWPSILHSRIFKNIGTITHITEYHPLINDTVCWDKLILRSFYERAGLSFPEGLLYEDIPFAVKAFLSCNKTAVMREVGYRWRVREGANRSITQNTSSLRNLNDRITALRLTDAVYAEKGCKGDLLLAKQAKALDDLILFVDECASLKEAEAQEVFKRINEYIDEAVPEEAFREISLLNRQKLEFVRTCDLDALKKLLAYREYEDARIEERDGRLIADVPEDLFTLADRDVTKEIENEAHMVSLDSVTSEETGLVMDVTACRRRGPADAEGQDVKVYLRGAETETLLRTEITGNLGKSIRVFADAKALDAEGVKDGRYSLFFRCSDRWGESSCLLRADNKGLQDDFDGYAIVAGGMSMRMDIGRYPEIGITMEKDPTVAESFELQGNELLLKVNGNAGNPVAAAEGTGEPVPFEPGRKEDGSFTLDCGLIGEGEFYALYDKESGKKILNKKHETGIMTGACDIVYNSQRDSVLKIKKLDEASFIRSAEKSGKRISVSIAKRCAGDKAAPVSVRLTVEDKKLGGYVYLSEEAECRRESGHILSVLTMDFLKDGLINNLYESRREINAEYSYADGKRVREQLYCIDGLTCSVKGKNVRAILYKSVDVTARLRIIRSWPEEESTPEKRQGLINRKYPEYRKEALKKTRILFESMEGTYYSGSPRSIYEYMDENFPEYECFWAFNDPGTPVKGKAKKVRRGSSEYYHCLATASFIITDSGLPQAYVKRNGQTLIQTTRGTPFKAMRADRADIAWDHLLAQSEETAAMLKEACHHDGNIIECGLPKTDRLLKAGDDEIRRIKSRLELPDNKKIILYAPTWRVFNRFDMMLDIESMRQALSDEYILLIRLHKNSVLGYKIEEDREFLFNFSYYSDISDLLLISDILITDYSSVAGDFMLLGRPVLFFAYDYEEYRKRRGLYIDCAEMVPEAFCTSTEEVIAAVRKAAADSVILDAEKRIREKYLSNERPDSTEKIVKTAIRPDLFSHWMYIIKHQIKKYIRPGQK